MEEWISAFKIAASSVARTHVSAFVAIFIPRMYASHAELATGLATTLAYKVAMLSEQPC